jgi:hypothetical protein
MPSSPYRHHLWPSFATTSRFNLQRAALFHNADLCQYVCPIVDRRVRKKLGQGGAGTGMHSAGYLSSHGNCIIAAYGHRAPRLSAKACGGLESFSWRAASFHQRSSGSVHSDNRGEEVWHRGRIPKKQPPEFLLHCRGPQSGDTAAYFLRIKTHQHIAFTLLTHTVPSSSLHLLASDHCH